MSYLLGGYSVVAENLDDSVSRLCSTYYQCYQPFCLVFVYRISVILPQSTHFVLGEAIPIGSSHPVLSHSASPSRTVPALPHHHACILL